MTELTKSTAPSDGALVAMTLEAAAPPSVRELLTELAALEDVTRSPDTQRLERQAALAREQEIIDELHRRCPEAAPPS